MARRRTVHGKISLNRELAAMSPFTCLTFTWGIAHCDDWGVISGDPVVFKAQVFPLRKEGVGAVAKAIDELVENGLIIRYERDGQVCLHYPGWDDHQEGLHKRSRSRTELPLPPGHALETTGIDPRRPRKTSQTEHSETLLEVPGSSRKFPPKGSEGKLSEENHSGAAVTEQAAQKKDDLDPYQQGLSLYCQALRTTDSDPAAEQTFAGVAAAYGDEAARDAAIITLQTFSTEPSKPRAGSVSSYLLQTARTQAEKIAAAPRASPLEKEFERDRGPRPTDPMMGKLWDMNLEDYVKAHGTPAA